jgi:hypothetical protein
MGSCQSASALKSIVEYMDIWVVECHKMYLTKVSYFAARIMHSYKPPALIIQKPPSMMVMHVCRLHTCHPTFSPKTATRLWTPAH